MVLVTIVFTSAVVLILVQADIINVKGQADSPPILNTEFIPLGREGYLGIKEFQFCESIGDKYNCLNERNQFYVPSGIYFRFEVETTPFNNQIMLVENYRIKDANGNVLLEAEDKNNLNFDMRTGKEKESVYFKDRVFIEEGDALGIYTLELIITNPLLDKKVTLVKQFEVVE